MVLLPLVSRIQMAVVLMPLFGYLPELNRLNPILLKYNIAYGSKTVKVFALPYSTTWVK
jgi:hypothetical protein